MNFWERHKESFSRSVVTALIAAVVDFGTMVLLVEVFHIYYVIAVATGAALGGVVNYIANRRWAFGSDGHVSAEAIRYTAVSGASLGWNTLLVFLLTNYLGLMYFYSRLIVALFVGIGWNYPLHKYWVFVKKEIPHA